MAPSPCLQISLLKSLLLRPLPAACVGCSVWDRTSARGRQLATTHVLLCLLKDTILRGDVRYASRQHLAARRPAQLKRIAQIWRNFRNSHLILAHAICAHREKQALCKRLINPVYKPIVKQRQCFPILRNCLFAAACSENDHNSEPCQGLVPHHTPAPTPSRQASCQLPL